MSITQLVAYVLCVIAIAAYGFYVVVAIINAVVEGVRDNRAAQEMRRHQINFERRWSDESPFI